MRLKKLKLNALSEAGLKDKEMNALKGGNCCTCSCYWEGKPGGSSSSDNSSANVNIGDNGGHSSEGCNQYFECNDSNDEWPFPNPNQHPHA
ncbi:TIGR04149 family rSAM-modified RiPP [Bacteroides stercorirosoris]|uniref:RSAM-modified peptide n=1 Tax=Bacteroides stercorirosoris TaxID=871324 RepID=A0A413HA79_9BACE|nr:TIGR04149 family rSAM-modified RiPP [Bacteroides stercorirosoris]RGX80594.1 rSAM-modified peptide [Bacteroides stercorirosoris]